MSYVSLIYIVVNGRRMNGRNMVLPNRDRVEKWAVDMVRIELLLIWLHMVSKSLLPPSGEACNGPGLCYVVCFMYFF